MSSDNEKRDENQSINSQVSSIDKTKDIKVGDTSNMLKHIETLERQLQEKNDVSGEVYAQ